MPDEYIALVAAMKALTQASGTTSEPDRVLPVAEDEWDTRPEAVSYGEIQLDFEADALNGDNRKVAAAYEGSFDLYSHKRDGDGWIPLIRGALEDHCDGAWRLNFHSYERETRLFHWEWVFQIEG